MFKQYKKQLIISSIVTLLPIVFGLLIWDQLPDMMATHWGVDNQPDSWSSKSFAVFGMPLLLLGLHWLFLWITAVDKSQKNQSKKAMAMIFWMMPMVSLFTSAIMYGVSLGHTVNLGSVLFMMLGLMFAGIGNYLPKTKRNFHLGIKVKWALNNEENWNATHRFGGKVWVMGGLLLMLAGFFPMDYAVFVMLPVILILSVIPALYSYLYYKKQCREGRGYEINPPEMSSLTRKFYRCSPIAVTLILIFVAVIMFGGNIICVFHDTSFTIEADHYDDLTVEYAAIDSIELRNESVPGTRSFGFGSARLLLGIFENEEFGQYTRYTYTNSECAVILTAGDKTLVLAGKAVEETEAIYETLLAKTGLGE